MKCIELTAEEKELLDRIDFAPASPERHDPAHWNAVGEAALGLMKSLIARKAVPEVGQNTLPIPPSTSGEGAVRAGTSRKTARMARLFSDIPVF